jgi:tripartite-type tricarboxylate transporter receptor subunit TctC
MSWLNKTVIPAKAGIQFRRVGNLLPTRGLTPEYGALFPGYILLSATIFATAHAAEAPYPNRPIRLVVSGVAGSSNFTARLIANGLSSALGQQVVVDGREGGVIAAEIAARAAPDGYTLHLNGSALWLLPFMRSRVPYDPVRDFAPVALAVSTPNILVIHPSVPVKSVRELIALAKAKPGELNYASGNAGTSNHLAAELFKSMAGVNITRIPYKGGAPAISDLVGGQVQLMFGAALAVAQHVQSGRLRALAVTSAKPSALVTGLPTVADAGVPGYASVAIFGVLAPAKTPPALIERLNHEIVKVLQQSDVKERLFNAGSEVVASTPAAFDTAIKTEMKDLGKLIRDAGIKDG